VSDVFVVHPKLNSGKESVAHAEFGIGSATGPVAVFGGAPKNRVTNQMVQRIVRARRPNLHASRVRSACGLRAFSGLRCWRNCN